MPQLVITTNVNVEDPKGFVQELSKLGAKLLEKPESYIAVSYTFNEHLSFGGSFDPTFLLSVTSLGNINPEANIKYSQVLFEFFKEKLGVEGTRGYISFIDPGRPNMGYNGTTFG